MTNDPETIAKLLETMIETQERSKREAHLADLTARISVLEKTTAKKDSLDKLENRLMRWMLGTAFRLSHRHTRRNRIGLQLLQHTIGQLTNPPPPFPLRASPTSFRSANPRHSCEGRNPQRKGGGASCPAFPNHGNHGSPTSPPSRPPTSFLRRQESTGQGQGRPPFPLRAPHVIPSGARNLPPSCNVRGLGGCFPAFLPCHLPAPIIPCEHRSASSRPLTQAKGTTPFPLRAHPCHSERSEESPPSRSVRGLGGCFLRIFSQLDAVAH